jgi:hypothetical protein
VAHIFFGHRGHVHDAPGASVAQGIPRQQTQKAREIETAVFARLARRLTSMLEESTT